MRYNLDEALLCCGAVDINCPLGADEQALKIALYNNYKHYEICLATLQKFGECEPFLSLKAQEEQNYLELIALCKKYGFNPPLNSHPFRVKPPQTLEECYEMGVGMWIRYRDILSELALHVNKKKISKCLQTLQTQCEENLATFRECTKGDMMQSVAKYQELATDIANGNIDEQKIMGLFSSLNASMVGGAVAGGAVVALLNQFINKSQE